MEKTEAKTTRRIFISENLIFPDQRVIYNYLDAKHESMFAECDV
jgi:hypothetical protein